MKKATPFKTGFMTTAGVIIALIIFSGIVYAGYVQVANWQYRQRIQLVTTSSSSVTSNVVTSESHERFLLRTPDRKAEFFLNITTNDNQTYLLGKFVMDYKLAVHVGDDSGQKFVDVLYYLPEDWLIKSATDFNISAEYKLKNPPIVKQERRDPIFYRGKDYPNSIPFDEIEITTDFVTQYTDVSETQYNFVIGVKETSPDFNIVNVDMLVPLNYSVQRE